MMEVRMPLYPDPEKHQMRVVELNGPDDLTQEEFWDFVLLMGGQLFGEREQIEDNKSRSVWYPAFCLREYELRKPAKGQIF
jgi:hypothetical protein